MVKLIFEIVAELLLVVCYPLIGLAKFIVPLEKINPHPTKKETVLIVERWLSQNTGHLYLKTFLEKQGYRVYWTNISLVHGDFEESAVKLQSYISKHQLDNIILVGISFGAITSLLYLEDHAGWNKVKKFISVAGSFHGTPKAKLFPFFTSTKQVTPKSDFVKKLNERKLKHPENVVCINTRQDEMVPFKSALLANTKLEVVDIYGHNNLHIWSRDTFDLILKHAKI